MTKKKNTYPGVSQNKAGKWIAHLQTGKVIRVATRSTFEEAKKAQIGFERGRR